MKKRNIVRTKMCGLPEDEIKGGSEMPDGSRVKKYCERCRDTKERRCLKCDIIFKPGCKVTRVCGECYMYNKVHDNEYYA